jgi:hypothetical protein
LKNNEYNDIPICHIQNIIQDKIINIVSTIENEAINDNNKNILCKLCNEIIDLTSIAEDKGQRMENRLKKYRRAVEELGFKRIKISNND